MSKAAVWSITIAAVLVLGAGAWWAGFFDDLTSKLNLDILQDEEQAVENTPEPAPSEPQSELTTGNDASNEALDEDLQALDAQMGAYGESSSELDASLNDEPVEQDSDF